MFQVSRLSKIGFILFCSVTMLAAAPNPVAVVNAASWVPSALPNGSIARGSLFIVTGQSMGPSTIQHANTYPLPTSAGLGGTTVQVTVGGTTNYCIMIYTVDYQVAAILPSGTSEGTGTLTVTYQGAVGNVPIHVVKNGFGIFAVNQQGSGPGVIDNAAFQLRVPNDAAHPGDVLIIWGTGLGPITSDETIAPPQVDLGTGVQVFVGGQKAVVSYGGRGSSAGLDQINFTVPAGVSGCYVSVVTELAGVSSNFTTVPVAAPGQAFCEEAGGLTAAELTKVVNGGVLNTGYIDLSTIAGNYAVADFEQWNYANLIASHGLAGGPSMGSCTVYNVPSGQGVVTADPFAVPGLDAGPQLNLTGPNGAKPIALISKGHYEAQLSAEGQPQYLAPGNYTIDNSSGGADIGAFKASLTIPEPLVWTNKDAVRSVSGSKNVTITWSGGGPNDVVSIIGITGLASILIDTEFFCSAPASAGTFTIPSEVLALLPQAGLDASHEPGADLIVGLVPSLAQTNFSAPGLDFGIFFSYTFTTSATVVSIQ